LWVKGTRGIKICFILAAAVGGVHFSAQLTHAGVPLSWDPNPAAGVQGGSGVWNTSAPYWDNSGVDLVWFNSHGDTAIFAGSAGGSVQLGSAITASALQIDVAGYSFSPAPVNTLTISSGSVIANTDVSIAVPISTPAGLNKSGAGTLTIAASGTIRGTILISGGAVAFTADAYLGGATNDVELANGGLRYSGGSTLTLGADHGLIVDAAGGRIDTPSARLLATSTGQISGAGTLTKLGALSFEISGANAGFSGSANSAGGTLVLQNALAINGRPITMTGGDIALRNAQPTDFKSTLSVMTSGSITVDRLGSNNSLGQVQSVGDVSVAAGATLRVGSSTDNVLGVHNLSLSGDLRLDKSALVVGGAFSGAGTIILAASSQPPEFFATGLIFANGLSQSISNPMTADSGGAGPVVGVGAGTTLSYGGVWNGGGVGGRSAVSLRDGGKFVVGAGARLNNLADDLVSVRPFIVVGNGSINSFDLDAAFVADHSAGGTIADGLAAIEVRDATLVTRSSASLPVVMKQSAFGGKGREGSITFSGTAGARWQVSGVDQQFDGGVIFNTSATIQTDKNLSHIGLATGTFDGSFQMPVSGSTLTKEGAGWLMLSGSQSYSGGSQIQVNAGGVRFNTDPGAMAGTLAVAVGGASNASVEFTAATSHVDSLLVNVGSVARLTNGSQAGEKILVTHSVSVLGDGQLDLGNGRLVVDYDASSPLGTIAAMIKAGRIVGGGNPSMAIGAAEASALLHISGTQSGMFGSETVDPSSVLARVTLVGDANLDGRVNFADFQRMELGFGLKSQGWSGGDFNYDGMVNGADFQLLYGNLGKDIALPPAPGNSVPEPVGLAYLGGLLVLGKRSRR